LGEETPPKRKDMKARICVRSAKKNLYTRVGVASGVLILEGDTKFGKPRYKKFSNHERAEPTDRVYGKDFYVTPNETISESVMANMLHAAMGLFPVSTMRETDLTWDDMAIEAVKTAKLDLINAIETETGTYRNINLKSNSAKSTTFMTLDGALHQVGSPKMDYERARTLLDKSGLWDKFVSLGEKYHPAATMRQDTHTMLEALNASKRNKDVVDFLDVLKNTTGGTPFYHIIACGDSMNAKLGTPMCDQNLGVSTPALSSDPFSVVQDRAERGPYNILSLNFDIYFEMSQAMYERIESLDPAESFSGVTSCLDGGIAWFEFVRDVPEKANIPLWKYFREDGNHYHEPMPLGQQVREPILKKGKK
jgi:hypothetical protein